MAKQEHTSNTLGSIGPNDWNSDEYEAGYQARLQNIGHAATATACWRAGWQDADREIVARGALEVDSSFACSDQAHRLSEFGTGELARKYDLSFEWNSPELWKRSWVQADVELGTGPSIPRS